MHHKLMLYILPIHTCTTLTRRLISHFVVAVVAPHGIRAVKVHAEEVEEELLQASEGRQGPGESEFLSGAGQ